MKKKMNKLKKIRSVILPLLMAWLYICSGKTFAAEVPEIDKIDGISHYEWETVCIYAGDVTYTDAQIRSLINQDSLDQSIISNANPEVRIGPSYELVADGIGSVNSEEVEAAVNTDGYRARLFIKGSETCYIDILVKVTPAAEAQETGEPSKNREAQPSKQAETQQERWKTEHSQPTENQESAVQAQGEDVREEKSVTAPEVSAAHQQEKGMGNGRIIAMYSAAFLTIGILAFFNMRKDLYVLRWYKRRMK